jgi:hypothetical protein
MRIPQVGFTGVLLTTLLAPLACSPDNPVGLRRGLPLKSALLEAPNIVAQAEAGTLGRGEQDLLVRFERQLPGFGGLYIANGAVRVYMKEDTIPLARVRAVLSNVYSGHPTPGVRAAMANVGTATVIKARYALSELIAIQRRVAGSIPGWTGVGTNIMDNKVVVGFPDSAGVASGLRAMGSAGIPADALTLIIMPPAEPTSNFDDNVRPARDGLLIVLSNDTYDPHGYVWKGSYYVNVYYGVLCSIGFNVHASSGDYFMTAAHCENSWRAQNGISGDTVWQSSRGGLDGSIGRIGQITVNPAWGYGSECPPNGQGGYYDYCVAADVALGQYTTTYGERKIAISQYGGVNGLPGTDHINNWYPITRVLTPEYVDSVMRHEVGKSAGITFTTSGPWVSDMMDVRLDNTVCWPVNHYGCFYHVSLYLWNQAIALADVAGGDSGGAVFTGDPGSGAPYAALGIVVAQSGRPDGLLPSQSCPNCRFIFSRWDFIEPWLGLGKLNPATSIP